MKLDKKNEIQQYIEKLDSFFSQDELNSLLLQLFDKKSYSVTEKSLLHQYENNRFTVPAYVDQKTLNSFDYLGYELIPENFESIELAPITVFGINRLLTPISQKNILATIRKSEVVSDTATALVLESIKKIRAQKEHHSHYIHKLCSSHRCLRLQDFSKNPKFTSHFRVFSLATSWHKANKLAIFENIYEHIHFYLSLLTKIQEKSFEIASITVEISHMPLIESIIEKYQLNKKEIMENTQNIEYDYIKHNNLPFPERINQHELITLFHKESLEMQYALVLYDLWEKVVEKLINSFSNVIFSIDLKRIAGVGYYNGACFKISAKNTHGDSYPLVDGGMVDWIEKIIHTNNFPLLTSCIGSELFCRFFKKIPI